MRTPANDGLNVCEYRVPSVQNVLIGQPNHQKSQARRHSVPSPVGLIPGYVMFAAVSFDDQSFAHEEVDAPYPWNFHLSLESDSHGPQP